MKKGRKFLLFFDSEEYDKFVPESDENKKLPPPLFQQPVSEESTLIDLIPHENLTIGRTPFLDVVNSRKSRRKFTSDPITLEDLSFLLWSTQGVREVLKSGRGVKRTVPSAGAKSPLETYLVINRIKGLEPGLYRYISFSHQLLFIKTIDNAEIRISELAYNQKFVGAAPVIFFWTAVPYRTEWRYTILSHKFIAIDLGITCENLYLACEAINLGTVAIGYYEQNKLDELFELNTEEEFVVLVAPVGKYGKEKKLSEFFKYAKKKIDSASLKRLEGRFQRTNLIEFFVKDNDLFIRVEDFEEALTPYNELEFTGEVTARAFRFELTKGGKPHSVLILSFDDEELDSHM
ncbi:SagB/ThcOx family dehydrogenase [Candidatus Thorarchaeota archaeon]|nr:MAG: SagB/ThcOx family dehydrogenase [Candidatus Thorarchaeota archaeon]